MKACNNAAWSLGELSIRLPPQAVQSYAGERLRFRISTPEDE